MFERSTPIAKEVSAPRAAEIFKSEILLSHGEKLTIKEYPECEAIFRQIKEYERLARAVTFLQKDLIVGSKIAEIMSEGIEKETALNILREMQERIASLEDEMAQVSEAIDDEKKKIEVSPEMEQKVDEWLQNLSQNAEEIEANPPWEKNLN